jgi:ABC-type multidrug transport system ATPase subunit
MELNIKNLNKSYPGGVQALKNFDLKISNGLFGLLGPNGAGKSTLMRTIATLQAPDSGSIFLDGLNVLEEKQKVRNILGYLPQEFGVYKNITAFKLLDHLAALKGIRDKTVRQSVVLNIMKQTNLYDLRNKKLGTFSGGMKQRFGVAQALIGNPKIVIVDEPTAGLDPSERKRFLNMLNEIGEQVIVILSTHIVDDVADICTDMAIIDRGELKYNDKPGKAIEKLKGKVWQKSIAKVEESQYLENYNVLSSKLNEGMIDIHVLSNESPGVFERTNPDLEDVYFAAIKNYITLN